MIQLESMRVNMKTRIKRCSWLTLFIVACFCTALSAQVDCSSSQYKSKLVCELPASQNPAAAGNFLQTTTRQRDVANGTFKAFNAPIAAQLTQLPIASPGAGTQSFSDSDGLVTPYESLGPILNERAQTIGKRKKFVGFSSQVFRFKSIDGIGFKSVPFASCLNYTAEPTGVAKLNTCSQTPSSGSYQEAFTSNLNLTFRFEQFVTFASYGLTRWLDVSAIVPANRVSLGTNTSNLTRYVSTYGNGGQRGSAEPLPQQISPNFGFASGIGDVQINVKAAINIGSGENTTIAGGLTVRTPTGNASNYLGSGAWGYQPYAVLSYANRLSTHAKLGYQVNTNTILVPDSVGANSQLPGGLVYGAGADYSVKNNLTVAIDFLGNQYRNVVTLNRAPYQVPLKPGSSANTPYTIETNSGQVTLANSNPVTSTYYLQDISGGLKFSLRTGLTLFGNVLYQMNSSGLRADPAPLVGLSYKF